MDKEDVAHIYGYYSAIKKNKILPFAATWIDVMLNEVSQMEKDKYNMILFICGMQKDNKLVNIT